MYGLARIITLTLVVAFSWGCSEEDKEKLKGDLATDGKAADKKVAPSDTGPGLEAAVYPEAGGDAALADAKLKPDITPDGSSSKYWDEFAYTPGGKLYSVMGTGATNVFAVGQKGLILKYNGSSWSTMTNPDASKSDLHQLIVHPTASKFYALGAQMYLVNTGSAWAKGYNYTTSYYYNFRGGWGMPNNYVYGVGEMNSGSYYYMSYKSSSGTSFSGISFGSSGVLKDFMYGVWGTANNKVWAVGNKGTILKCNASSSCTSSSYWKKETSGTTSHLRAVYGFSNSDVFAVGYDGVIVRYDGSKWNKMTTNTSTYFQGVWGSSPTNVFAVGHPIFKSEDSIFHYDGSKWYRVAPPKTSYCNSVWGSSASDVFVVCNYNILKYKGP